ncbi:MAG TPA: DUF3781 domain-containing protein [Bacteroidales bacterium]|nr:DUF3781 domain-containing protein [Bacteroidales bacterium]
MDSFKREIINGICYTDLVYGRINKKLNRSLSRDQIEKMITDVLEETDDSQFKKIGKNYYVTNSDRAIRITINSYTFRVITADSLTKINKNLLSTSKILS